MSETIKSVSTYGGGLVLGCLVSGGLILNEIRMMSNRRNPVKRIQLTAAAWS